MGTVHSVLLKLCCCAILALWAIPAAHAQQQTTVDGVPNLTTYTADDTGSVAALLKRAAGCGDGNVILQYTYANEALLLSAHRGPVAGGMLARQALGACYERVMAYDDAIACYRQAAGLAVALQNAAVLQECLRRIVDCLRKENRLQEAIACQQLLLRLVAGSRDSLLLCRELRTYAMCLSAAGNHPAGIYQLRRAIALAGTAATGQARAALLADQYNALATVYNTLCEKDSTLQCLRAANHFVQQAGNAWTAAYILSSYCDVYYTHHEYGAAIRFGLQTLQAAAATHNLDMQRYYTNMVSHIYEQLHRPAPALKYHLLADSLSAVQFNLPKVYADGRQLLRISLQQQAAMSRLEEQAYATAQHNSRTILIAAAAALLLLLALTAIIYRSLRQNRKANHTIGRQAARLQQQNTLVQEALQAKELMLQETHHRIKNNLQLISSLLELQLAGIGNGQARQALYTAQRRIQSIAMVHSKLLGTGSNEPVPVAAFVADLFKRLAAALDDSRQPLHFRNDIPAATLLPLNMVMTLGLILNELITNTFKYACKQVSQPELCIQLQQVANGNYILEYTDKGAPLPPGMAAGPEGSLGLQLVAQFSRQLKGTLHYTHDGGNRFTISFPATG